MAALIKCEYCNVPDGLHAPDCVTLRQPTKLLTRVVVDMEPNQVLIEFLEKQLELARSGTLRAVAIAIVNRDDVKTVGEVDYGWSLTTDLGWALDRAVHRLRYFWDKHTHEDQ